MAEEQYDRFVKRMQASDEYQQPEMPAAAWEKMEAKLDDAFGKKKKRRRFWFFLLIPVLLTGAWFVGMQGKKAASGEEAMVSQKPKESNLETKTPARSSGATTDSAAIVQHSTPNAEDEIIKEVDPNGNRQLMKSNPSVTHQRIEVNARRENHGSAMLSRQKHDKQNGYKVKTQLGLDFISEASASPQGTPRTRPERLNDPLLSETNSSPPIIEATPHQFPPDSFHFSRSLVLDRTALDLSSLIERPKTLSSTKSKPRFFAGLTGMYSASGVSLSRLKKGTGGYGVQFGLLWKRFSLTTGLNASKVIYSARGNEYAMQDNYVPYGYKLQSVDANCYILDIPIVLNYHFPAKHKTSFFVGAGIASQLMKKEDYDYTLERYSMTRKGTWSYKNENEHFLSLAQVNAGIKHRFSNNLFLQASPFFRTPLKGIGEGKIHLRTLGLQASLNLFPFSSKK